MSQRTHTPPRLLILALPAGIYTGLRYGLEEGAWDGAAAFGALVFALVLFGPALLRTSVKAAAVRSASKKKEGEEK